MGILDFMDDHPGWASAGLIGLVGASLIGGCTYNSNPQSSRTLNPAGKQMKYQLPQDFKRMISVSSAGSEGDALITYESTEGEIISKKYNRMGLFETTTTIDWKQPNKK